MRYQVDVHLDARGRLGQLAEDVRHGLTARPKFLPPKYFYDAVGSALFDRVTRLPEYYLTRVEESLLRAHAPMLMRGFAPVDIVELGSGSAAKTRVLFDARNGAPASVRYVPLDVDPEGLEATAARLVKDYPFLSVHAVVGDFERHLAALPARVGRRLVLFLGSTIGNLDPAARRALLARVRGLLADGDRFLLGVDLVKDVAVLEAAYDDAAGVTREFNRNILRVINRGAGGDFVPEAYRHIARYDAAAARIEMHLAPATAQTVHLRRLDLTVEIAAEERIWTESSYKFTRESAAAELAATGLAVDRWLTDSATRFALVLAAPA